MIVLAIENSTRLGQAVARLKKTKAHILRFSQFADGEYYLRLPLPVFGKRVALIGAVTSDASSLVRYCLCLNALKENGAKHILAVIPYCAYLRQDRVDKPGAPLSAKFVAKTIEHLADKVVLIDPHSEAAASFFKKRILLSAQKIIAQTLPVRLPYIIVAPDNGAKNFGSNIAQALGVECIVFSKQRKQETIRIFPPPLPNGYFKNKTVVIVDDMVGKGSTLIEAAKICHKAGAKQIWAAATHAVLPQNAPQRLRKSHITRFYFSDTLPAMFLDKSLHGRIKVFSVAPLIASVV